MASAGQAHAPSSQPTHFSRPSGCRLSWWRPWKRGCVGRFSSGYSSVSSLRNIVAKVTPKPPTGAKRSARNPPFFCSSATGGLLLGCAFAAVAEGHARLLESLSGQGRHRVAARERVDLLRRGGVADRVALDLLVVPQPDREQRGERDDDDEDDAEQREPAVAQGQGRVTEVAELAATDESHDDDPGQRHGDEELPAEAHELVVADTGQRAAQPHEEEHEQPELDDEPEQAPPA